MALVQCEFEKELVGLDLFFILMSVLSDLALPQFVRVEIDLLSIELFNKILELTSNLTSV